MCCFWEFVYEGSSYGCQGSNPPNPLYKGGIAAKFKQSLSPFL